MRHFSIAVDIEAPPARVWAVMSDVERWHEWTASIRRVRKLNRGPLAAGLRVVITQPGFPPALWRVSAIEDGHYFIWTSRAPGLSVVARHEVEPTLTGTRATLALEFKGLLGGWFGRLTQSVNHRYLAMEAAGLKRRSEAGA